MVDCKHEAPEWSIVNTRLLPFGTHSLSHTSICTHACICKPCDGVLNLPFVLLTLTVNPTNPNPDPDPNPFSSTARPCLSSAMTVRWCLHFIWIIDCGIYDDNVSSTKSAIANDSTLMFAFYLNVHSCILYGGYVMITLVQQKNKITMAIRLYLHSGVDIIWCMVDIWW